MSHWLRTDVIGYSHSWGSQRHGCSFVWYCGYNGAVNNAAGGIIAKGWESRKIHADMQGTCCALIGKLARALTISGSSYNEGSVDKDGAT